ncbi:hypothetical protein OF376_02245 [Ureaplasma miroungigenitalium]|uniref:Uncharacterized protein n=1 Tax=Ureaplasma miroungigenitalium TaxID=1042321 RepID=A0ABT3BMX8_9BACT|nr:hypothetical protein [Ureaplasma miroungigenitalium]MCV3728584.1 hypothetical protein [Ureaplasma miroungigenitalium]MCV3734409.1 hypothetical protein [Ureaplasma miroungigenitalium]
MSKNTDVKSMGNKKVLSKWFYKENYKIDRAMNILVVAFAFACFACALIGAWNPEASKWIIGFGAFIMFAATITVLVLRTIKRMNIHKWTRKEIIWQSVMYSFWAFALFGLLFGLIVAAVRYDHVVFIKELLGKQKAGFIPLTGLSGQPGFEAYLAGLWIMVIGIGAAMFVSVFYNMAHPVLKESEQVNITKNK